MEDKTNIRLTAAEMAGLWTQYLNDTLTLCMSTYFLEKVEDEEVRPIVEYVSNMVKRNISIMEEIFKKENFPIPLGFTDQDVNPKAPRLFSDTFVSMYFRGICLFFQWQQVVRLWDWSHVLMWLYFIKVY